MAQQQVRINFPQESEQMLNTLIQKYQEISEVYQQMGCFFMRDEVAMRPFEMLVWRRSDKLRVGVAKLIRYQNKRGGRVQFQDIPKPQQTEWKNILEALRFLLPLEKQIVQIAEQLSQIALKNNDSETQEYVHSKILPRQTRLIKKICDSIVTLQKNGEGLPEFLFCQHVIEPVVVKETLKLMQKTPYVYPRYIKNENIPTDRVILPRKL